MKSKEEEEQYSEQQFPTFLRTFKAVEGLEMVSY